MLLARELPHNDSDWSLVVECFILLGVSRSARDSDGKPTTVNLVPNKVIPVVKYKHES